MKNVEQLLDEQVKILPYTITQGLVGLESSSADNSLVRYVDFFTQKIPSTSAFFLHVVPELSHFSELIFENDPKFDLELLASKNAKTLESRIEETFTGSEHLNVEVDVKVGNPLEVLLASAREMKADLVIIGQKNGTKHHGILAKKFARKASANALIIPEKSKPKIKTILVPIDFSENSIRALQTAVGIKKQWGNSVKLTVLNVLQMPNLSSYKLSRSPAKLKSYVMENVKETFGEFIDKYVPAEKEEIDLQLLFKDTPKMAEHIYSFATDHEVDLMVMGAKGHSRLERLLMGSVTEKILSLNQTFPTMVVK
jgi:nucleotide-binding universal stress UspA family protein